LHSFAFDADMKNLKHNRDFRLFGFSDFLSENLAQCVDWSDSKEILQTSLI